MTWSVKNSELLLVSVEGGSSNLNCFALGLFLLANVHAVGEPPRVTAFVLGVTLVLLDHALVDATHEVHDLTGNGGLARINVANENQGAGLASLVDLDDLFLVDLDVDVLDVLGLDLHFLLGHALLVAFLVTLFLGGVHLILVLVLFILGLAVAAEVGILVGVLVFLLLVVLLLIFLGSGRLAVALLSLESRLFLILETEGLIVEPNEDIGRIHRVLWVVLEDKDHLFLRGRAGWVRKELLWLTLGGQQLLGLLLLLLDLLLGWLLLLLLAFAASEG